MPVWGKFGRNALSKKHASGLKKGGLNGGLGRKRRSPPEFTEKAS